MRTIHPDDLPALAAEALAASGLTQTAAAAELGAQQTHVNRAIKQGGSYDALRIRIIERWGGVQVEGPVYVVRAA